MALMFSWFFAADPTLAKSDWCRHFGVSDSIWLIHGQHFPKVWNMVYAAAYHNFSTV